MILARVGLNLLDFTCSGLKKSSTKGLNIAFKKHLLFQSSNFIRVVISLWTFTQESRFRCWGYTYNTLLLTSRFGIASRDVLHKFAV